MQIHAFSALAIGLLLLFEGCARAAVPVRPPLPQTIPPLPERYDACAAAPQQCGAHAELLATRQMRAGGALELLLSGPLAGAPAASKKSSNPLRLAERAVTRALGPSSKPVPGAPSATPTAGPNGGRALVDLEAHLALEVEDSQSAGRAVRALTLQAGGDVVNETIEDSTSASGVALSLRVPSERAEWLIARISELGKVRSAKTQANDVSRKVADAETVLTNLQAALTRYQALLERAQTAQEMTVLEKELERVRLSIERVKTDLEWLKDRVTRSTVYVQLSLPREERLEHGPRLYPGVRLPYLLALEPGGTNSGYFGGGLSALIARPFNLDLDLLTRTDPDERDGVDLLLASAGVELYSNLLGGGRRRLFNPYLGFRVGYANLSSDHALLLGGSLGLELVRTSVLVLDLQARAYALVGAERGTHVLLQPALALNFAY